NDELEQDDDSKKSRSALARACPSKVAIHAPSPSRTISASDGLFVEATDRRNRPLPIVGFKGTPEEIERQWYEQVYRGRGDSMAQLTWRALLIGSCLGALLPLPPLYTALPPAS